MEKKRENTQTQIITIILKPNNTGHDAHIWCVYVLLGVVTCLLHRCEGLCCCCFLSRRRPPSWGGEKEEVFICVYQQYVCLPILFIYLVNGFCFKNIIN